jgi:mannose-6-phosphate isomerase-like protein (cupin superfamily)
MESFELAELLSRRSASGRPYLEFLRVPDLSAGLYVLGAGEVDGQSPHAEDELYLVVSGRARFRASGASRTVGPGTVLFVPAREPHAFHDIEEELRILVVFGPAEGSAVS